MGEPPRQTSYPCSSERSLKHYDYRWKFKKDYTNNFRFHDLSEFDDRKRSCCRRLSARNARCQRPQSDEIQFSSTRMSSSICDQRAQMNPQASLSPQGFELSRKARAQADLKFMYVVSCQIYGQQKQRKKKEAMDSAILLQRFKMLQNAGKV